MFKLEKGNNYKFIDHQMSQMFQVGGVDVYVHKYLGTNTDSANSTAEQPHYDKTDVTNIQDLLFLENRDRKYDEEIYRIRGIYNVQNIDFNLSQFGLFIDNDTIYMLIHINDFITYVGRKPLSGDVMELPHLRDDFALNDLDMALPRYFVIEDVGRASEGFSASWWPHLYRLKLKKVTNSQQFADIFNKPALDANGDPTDSTLHEILATNAAELAINDSIIAQSEIDARLSGYESRQFYTLSVDPKTGKPILETNGSTISNGVPLRSGYSGYLMGDGFPVNGYDFGHGIQFPENALDNDFFLRTDFLPNRLFRFDYNRWVRVEDSVRMTMTNTDTRQTLKTSFINNTNYIYFDEVLSDYITLDDGITNIDTHADFKTAPFIVLKMDTLHLDFALIDYPNIIENKNGKLSLHLPVSIPETGQWMIGLYNTREAQRQSLSKALRPKADL